MRPQKIDPHPLSLCTSLCTPLCDILSVSPFLLTIHHSFIHSYFIHPNLSQKGIVKRRKIQSVCIWISTLAKRWSEFSRIYFLLTFLRIQSHLLLKPRPLLENQERFHFYAKKCPLLCDCLWLCRIDVSCMSKIKSHETLFAISSY